MKTEEFLLQHVDLTRKRVEAYERHLNLLFREDDFASKNTLATFDVFIDILKNTISVSFTGYVALIIVNPQWINFTLEAQHVVLYILVVSCLLISIVLLFRYRVGKGLIEKSDKRIATIKSLTDAEIGCISGIIEQHSKLVPESHL